MGKAGRSHCTLCQLEGFFLIGTRSLLLVMGSRSEKLRSGLVLNTRPRIRPLFCLLLLASNHPSLCVWSVWVFYLSPALSGFTVPHFSLGSLHSMSPRDRFLWARPMASIPTFLTISIMAACLLVADERLYLKRIMSGFFISITTGSPFWNIISTS